MLTGTTRHARRLAAALVAALLLAAGLTVAGAGPAAADHGVYLGSRSPMTFGGADYTDSDPDHGFPGAWYWGFADGGFDEKYVDEGTAEEIRGIDGDSDIDVALATLDFGAGGTRMMTVYVDSDAFSAAVGGPYARDCTGFNSLAVDVAGGWVQSATCVAFRASVLQANGHGNDFTFTPNPGNFDGFTDSTGAPLSSGSVTVTTGFVDPSAVSFFDPTPVYQGTPSPFRYGGTTFDANIPPLPGDGGAAWWSPHDGPPEYITGASAGIPWWPNPTEPPFESVHVALATFEDRDLTLYVYGSALGFVDPTSPFPANCTGIEDLLNLVAEPTSLTCHAFRADLWTPPDVLGEQFACAADWEGGWTDGNGDPIVNAAPSLVDGAPTPALTPVGVNDGPGVCEASSPPAPPGATPTGPVGGSDPGDGGTGAGPGATGGAVPTLPATGIDLAAVLTFAALIAGTGFGLTVLGRRQRLTPRTARARGGSRTPTPPEGDRRV